MAAKKEKFGIGKVVFMSVAAVLVAVLLLATVLAAVVANGISQVTQTFIRSNPETISMINAVLDSEDSDDNNLIMTLLWAKYASGSVGGKVEGSFTGRFTTEKVRSVEKVNLSCVDKYDYQIVTVPSNAVGVFKANTVISERRFEDNNCEMLGRFSKPDILGSVGLVIISNESYVVYRCPLRNCQMREKTTEVAGEFIPERIDISDILLTLKKGEASNDNN